MGAPRASTSPARDADSGPLAGADRRETLLDAAAALVSAGDVDRVSMDAVASAAGVSRALVYKHFRNRRALLTAVYERESAHLHARLSAAVIDAATLEEMLRVLIEGSLAAQASRGATLAALAASAARPRSQRAVQRHRDLQTLRYFSRQAATELGLAEADAMASIGIALGATSTVLAAWRLRPTPANAAHLADVYVAMTMGGLRAIAATPTRVRPAPTVQRS